MKQALKYILFFFFIEFVAVIMMTPFIVVSGFDKILVCTIASGVANAVVIVFLLRNTDISLKSGFENQSPGRILVLSCLLQIFLLLPFSKLNMLLDLPNEIEDLEEIKDSLWGLLVVGIIAPVAEELLLRGAVLGSLLKWERLKGNTWLAILISAALFSLIHFNPAQMPPAFLIGILLGWLVLQTGSLLPGICIHIVNNSVSCILQMAFGDIMTETFHLGGSLAMENVLTFLSLVLSVGCFLLLYRAIKGSNGPIVRCRP